MSSQARMDELLNQASRLTAQQLEVLQEKLDEWMARQRKPLVQLADAHAARLRVCRLPQAGS